ncbi:MAG: hypothetical protein HYZ87_03145, partial [Candidatus Omnitrophica bacterium]|nr:hypothetical protein [Candidatus Omnitrophota bacterium]
MKKILWGLTAGAGFFLCSVGVVAGAEANLLDQRVREAHLAVDKMMSAPDQSIPEELLAKCKAVAIYPSVLKGGFV